MKNGFTLIEILVVLGILIVLSVVALPIYKRYMLIAKTSEAKMNIGAIMTCEDSYAQLNDLYLTEAYYPLGMPGPEKREWNIDSSGHFKDIGFAPAGKVYYSYGVDSGNKCNNPEAANPNHGSVPATAGTDISVIAKGDLDGDGIFGYFCTTDTRYPEIKRIIGDF